MRILHLVASPYWSGPTELVMHLCLAMRAAGHEVSVAVDRKRAEAPSEELAVPRLQAVEVLDEGGLELSAHSGPLAFLRDVRRLRARTVDVVHAHMSHDHFVASLGRPRGALLVRSVHAPRSLRRLMPPADAFTVPSPRELAEWPRQPTVVLPSFAGPEFVPPVDREALRRRLDVTGAPVIGMISTFQPSRRHALGLEAFAQLAKDLPSARLYLIGDGALEPALRATVRGLGLDERVFFPGYQSGANFVAWLQCLDQVWILGLGNEHGGRAAMQARAVGARVLAVAEGGLPELADVVLDTPTPEALRLAARAPTRREVPVLRREEAADRLMALYRERGRS